MLQWLALALGTVEPGRKLPHYPEDDPFSRSGRRALSLCIAPAVSSERALSVSRCPSHIRFPVHPLDPGLGQGLLLLIGFGAIKGGTRDNRKPVGDPNKHVLVFHLCEHGFG